MPFFPITTFYTILLSFLMLRLAFQVVKVRQKQRQGLGHNSEDLLVAGRNHANFTEYVPMSLLLMAFAELNGVGHGLLHVFGATLLAARLLHAFGFRRAKGLSHSGRYWGTVLTFLIIALLSLVNLAYIWPFIL